MQTMQEEKDEQQLVVGQMGRGKPRQRPLPQLFHDASSSFLPATLPSSSSLESTSISNFAATSSCSLYFKFNSSCLLSHRHAFSRAESIFLPSFGNLAMPSCQVPHQPTRGQSLTSPRRRQMKRSRPSATGDKKVHGVYSFIGKVQQKELEEAAITEVVTRNHETNADGHRNSTIRRRVMRTLKTQEDLPRGDQRDRVDTLRHRQQSQRRTGCFRRGIWNSDAHLHLLATTLEFVKVYKYSLWELVPLHPAAFDEHNLQLVCSDRSEEKTTLSLHVNILLSLGIKTCMMDETLNRSIGALMAGNVELAREFRAKAREDLGGLFDMSDYTVAQALVALAYLDSRIGDSDPLQSLYYLRLGMDICRQLGARHTDVYLRCLIILAASPQVPKDELPELCRECEYRADAAIRSVVFDEVVRIPSAHGCQ
jgi:hypothetical protein